MPISSISVDNKTIDLKKEYKKKVCIVGNAQSLISKNLGKTIDSYDIVVRLNRCYTEDLKEDSGTKCTHWFLNQMLSSANAEFVKNFFKNKIDELIPHGLHHILYRVDDQTKNLKRFHNNSDPFLKELKSLHTRQLFNETCIENGLTQTSVFIREEVKHFFPDTNIFSSTGLGAICYFLRRYETVNIVGFGEREGELTLRHYWPPDIKESSKNFENNDHSFYDERDLINSLPVGRLDT